MKKTALITGASAGIGYELAVVYARAGYDLVLAARSRQKLVDLGEGLKEKYGSGYHVFETDLSQPGAGTRLFTDIQGKGLKVDVLINNAGFGDLGPFTLRNLETHMQMIHLNIGALTELTWHFAREMADAGEGEIMNVASTAAFQPGPLMAVYYATKAFVLHFSEALAMELKKKGVTVMALCPGPTASDFQQRAGMSGVRIEKLMPIATSRSVAEHAFRAMQRKKTVAIPGIVNQLGVFLVRLIPRRLSAQMVYFISKKI